jgi:DNA-binding transcriptional LysR family regulator
VKITLDAVEALDAVVRHGSFAAAAKAMHKAQSAVSYGIKQLEDGLGVALFDRAGHRAVLTDAGRMVVEEGRVILARVRRVESLAARFHEDWEPRVEAVIDGIFPMQPVMEALKRMADEGVPTSIQIKVEFLGGVQDRFEKDGADLMLVKDYVRTHRLVEHALPNVEVVLVAAAGHPLVSGAGSLTLSDLQRHVELTVHDSSESRRLVDDRLFGSQRVFFLSDFFTKRQAVAMGLGFGWMPLFLVQDELSRGVLREVPYRGGSRYAFAPMLVHPRDKPLGRAGAMLLSLLGESSAERTTAGAGQRRRGK